MRGQTGDDSAARVSPVDPRGRPIGPSVLSAAEEVSNRAIQHAKRLFVDPAVAANLLEEAAAAVSRSLRSKNAAESSVRDLNHTYFVRS
jgi:hypothetical protein